MGALIGLKFLQRNVAFRANARRHRRIPRGIEYYSRFANQLNFLRTNENFAPKQLIDNHDINSNFGIHLSSVNLFNKMSADYDNDNSNSKEIQDDKQGKTQTNSNSFDGYFSTQIEYNENNYIYKHVHKRLNNFVYLVKMVDSLPVYPQVKTLRQTLSKNLPKAERDKSVEEILTSIHSFIKFMNQQELAVLLTAIKNETQPEFKRIMRMIDIELRWLMKTHVKTRLMDLDLWFYCADIFYECLFKSNFVYVLVNYLVRESDTIMTNAQFIHLLFLVVLQRNQQGVLTTFENRIMQVLKTASFADLSTISMAYFKTKTQITNPAILSEIIDKTAEFLPQIDPSEPGYCSIIKSIRYSQNTGCRENVSHLIMSLTNDIDHRIILASPYNLVHTIKLMESYRIYDEKLLNMLYKELFDGLDNFRIKDIQYSLTSLSNFSYNDLRLTPNMKRDFDRLVQEIIGHNRHDSQPQYFHLMPLLRAFTIFGYYNKKFIQFVFDSMLRDDKLALMKPALEFDKSALLIHTAVAVEGKFDATELRSLSDNEKHLSYLRSMSNAVTRYGNLGNVRKDSSLGYLRFLLENSTFPDYYVNSKHYRNISLTLETHQKLRDPAYKLCFQYTLPHQNYADLVITKNCSAPGPFDKNTLKPKMVPKNEKHCILLATTRFDYIDGHQKLCGYKRLVGRLLEKLGYIVIEIDLNNPRTDELAVKIKSFLG